MPRSRCWSHRECQKNGVADPELFCSECAKVPNPTHWDDSAKRGRWLKSLGMTLGLCIPSDRGKHGEEPHPARDRRQSGASQASAQESGPVAFARRPLSSAPGFWARAALRGVVALQRAARRQPRRALPHSGRRGHPRPLQQLRRRVHAQRRLPGGAQLDSLSSPPPFVCYVGVCIGSQRPSGAYLCVAKMLFAT